MFGPLEKARKDPESRKALILKVARKVFGEYGYHGATMRVIAKEVGIDISTLYYHWGEKEELYQAVIMDITDELRGELVKVERIISGMPLAQRIEIALDNLTDYLFANREVSNLNLWRYFSKTRAEMTWDSRVPLFAADIARSMGLEEKDGSISVDAKMQVMTMMMAMHNFISGEDFFRSSLELGRDSYIEHTKRTLKFIIIPAFAG